MKILYGFRYNFKDYRSTNKDLLKLFADCFGFVVTIEEVGMTSEDVELERV